MTVRLPSLNRRTLLRAGAAGLLLPRTLRAELPANPDVVVIGAGAAGLAAAMDLIDRGHSVALIEASGRIGGRAHTDHATFGVPFDVGAHWLHNDSSNPFNAWGREHGYDIYPAPDTTRLFVGDRPATGGEEDALWRTWDAFYDAIGEAADSGLDVSAARATRGIGGDWSETVGFGIGPWSMGKDLDAFSTLDWWNSSDGEDWFCRQGFGTLVAHWGRDVPVSLSTAARRVDWSGPGVTVETDKGTISARAVVVTVSTGVLAADSIAFSPALPAAKQESFAAIPMGLYNHVAIRFSADLFGLGEDGYVMYRVGEDGRAFGVLNNASGTGISYCDVGGSFAQELEAQGEDAAIDFVMAKMNDLTGGEARKAFEKAAVTRWGSNPLTLGSYASASPGDYGYRSVLRETVGERIFFAGEACHPTLWATVAGAALSGETTAREVARMLG